ncbi:MAG: hypothetical protein OEN55_00455 [Alphaproteobacteria bacterium]|nr:hypothetical protein [Alphaproteobacteria bacterium]
MDKQRILNTSFAAAAAVNGIALLMVIVVVWLLGALLPVTYGGFVEKLAFTVAAGTAAFGLRRLVRKIIVPRVFAPGPVDPEMLAEFKEHRSTVMLVWWGGIILGLLCLAFPLELIREGAAFALAAALVVLSREKILVEYYLLKTED